MRKTLLLLAALPLAIAACDALDDRACTLIGCADSLVIDLPDELPAGTWTFEIATDDQRWTCVATLPLEKGAALPPCSGFDVAFHADDWQAPRLDAIRLDWAPTEVEFVATLDGEEVHRQALRPRYEETYPNGRECDETPCRNARVEAEVLP